MSSITSNIDLLKKYLMGGVDKVYLMPYVKYSRSQITIDDQYITSFPSTTIYEWNGLNVNYNETTEIISGDVAWNQNMLFDIPKTNGASEVYKLVKCLHRLIYIDRQGVIRMMGVFNGLDAQLSNESGTEKSTFNGYRVTLTGKEDNQAYFLNDLNDFTIHTINNYVFQDGCNYVFEDGNNFIFN